MLDEQTVGVAGQRAVDLDQQHGVGGGDRPERATERVGRCAILRVAVDGHRIGDGRQRCGRLDGEGRTGNVEVDQVDDVDVRVRVEDRLVELLLAAEHHVVFQHLGGEAAAVEL